MSRFSKLMRRITGKPNASAQWLAGPVAYNEDGLATRHNCDFMKEPRFIKACQAATAAAPQDDPDRKVRVHWRLHVASWFATQVLTLPGDFVECGVHYGQCSRFLVDYLDLGRRNCRLFLLDTFTGLKNELLTEAEREMKFDRRFRNHYTHDIYQNVVATFAPFDFVHIIQGPVPDTLAQVNTDQVRFVHIDMNSVKPEIAAAEFFWEKLVPGGIILLDDYGWRRHINQKLGFDEFAAQRSIEILHLPTGQGVIMKPLRA